MNWIMSYYLVICWSTAQNNHLPPATAEPQRGIWNVCQQVLSMWGRSVCSSGSKPHSGSVRLRISSSDLGWTNSTSSWWRLQLLISNSVWSELSPNLRPVPLLTLPESIQPSRVASTWEGINDSGQEIPHLSLIKFFFSKSSRLTLFWQKRGSHSWSTSTLMHSMERAPLPYTTKKVKYSDNGYTCLHFLVPSGSKLKAGS